MKKDNSIKEGLEVSDAIYAFCEAWGLSDGAATDLVEKFNDNVVEIMTLEGVDPYEDES